MGLNCRCLHDVIAMPLIPIVQEVGYRGIPIDIDRRSEMLFDIQLRLGSLSAKMRAEGLDIGACKSPASVGWRLRELGVPLEITTDGGQLKTDLEVIGRLNWEHNTKRERNGKAAKFPVLKLLMDYRRIEKARANLEAIVPCDDGLLRTRLQAVGTATARYASAGFGTKTKIGFCPICRVWGRHGTNCQNISRACSVCGARKDKCTCSGNGIHIKDIFVARPGWKLAELDMKAFELVIQAHRIQSAKMISRLETPGADPHSTHAALMYPGFDKNTADGKRQRDTMKNVIYGLRGGGGDRALLNAMAKKDEYYELADIAKFRSVIEAEYPEMPAWIADTAIMLEEQLMSGQRRIIWNALGRPRVLLGRAPLKPALATEISGTAAEIMNCIFVRLATYHPEEFKYVVLQVHDSIMVHAPAAIFDAVMEVVAREMQRAVWLWSEFVTFGVDIKVGEQWSLLAEAA
jgi:DNA polymerase I-like protein with 3'-5' exonuclease and polymerase domains